MHGRALIEPGSPERICYNCWFSYLTPNYSERQHGWAEKFGHAVLQFHSKQNRSRNASWILTSGRNWSVEQLWCQCRAVRGAEASSVSGKAPVWAWISVLFKFLEYVQRFAVQWSAEKCRAQHNSFAGTFFWASFIRCKTVRFSRNRKPLPKTAWKGWEAYHMAKPEMRTKKQPVLPVLEKFIDLLLKASEFTIVKKITRNHLDAFVLRTSFGLY